MHQDYWFLAKGEYKPLLERFAIAEPDYLAALQEVTKLFPRAGVTKGHGGYEGSGLEN
jgi:hypothetical protein